jgi:hypothetical protein
MTAMSATQATSHRTGTIPLLFALAAGPAGWIGQLVLDYGIAGYACYGGSGPRLSTPPTGWPGERALLLGLNGAGLALAFAGGLIAYRAWRDLRSGRSNPATAGRTRFLATCGMFSAAGFGAAILFGTIEPFMVSTCWRAMA